MTPEERQAALLDAYLDALQADRNALPPPDLEPQMASQARMMIAALSTADLSSAQTSRMWAQVRTQVSKQAPANGRTVAPDFKPTEEEMMTSQPATRQQRRHAITLFSWGVAAAVTLVTLAIIALVSNRPPQPQLGAPLLQESASPSPFPTPTMSVPTATLNLPTPTMSLMAAFNWPSSRTMNVLILGIDQRGDEQGPFRTDTVIVANIDPISKAISLLSIPRDLWVNIPGYQQGRMNTANFIGDQAGYPGGGPALAMSAIQATLGIPIDRYVRLNFDVFTSLVNALAPEGVEVCPEQAIDDPNYPDDAYGTIALHFDAGCQRLDAERLLQYSRTRATEGGDFDRAARQQEVLQAIYDTLATEIGNAWPGLMIMQIPDLWDELMHSFDTNFTLDELIGLASIIEQIPQENIHSAVLDERYVQPGVTDDGASVLVLQPEPFIELRAQIFPAAAFYPEIEPLGVATLEIPEQPPQAILYALDGSTFQADSGDQIRRPLSSITLYSGEVIPAPDATPVDGWIQIERYNRASRWVPANQVEIVPLDLTSPEELRGLCVVQGSQGNGYDLRTMADQAAQFIGHVNYPNRMQVLGHMLGSDGAIWYLVEGDSGGIRIRGWAPAALFIAEDESCPPGAGSFMQ